MGRFILAFAVMFAAGFGTQAQVTSNVLQRVLQIRVNGGKPDEMLATAFTIDVDGREYLITAKHVVASLKERDSVDIFIADNWRSLDVQIFRCDDPVDIAVLIPPYQLTVNFELSTEATDSFFIAQDALFLGFPFGARLEGNGANGPYPFAVVKRGLISGVVPIVWGKSVM